MLSSILKLVQNALHKNKLGCRSIAALSALAITASVLMAPAYAAGVGQPGRTFSTGKYNVYGFTNPSGKQASDPQANDGPELDDPAPSPSPTPSPTPQEPNDLGNFLAEVTIIDDNDKEVTDGKLFLGEKYTIKLKFAEGGAQSKKQFAWSEDDTMTFQLPPNFKVDPQTDVPLTIKINNEDVMIGTYSVSADGKLTVTLNEDGKKALGNASDAAINFDMDATVQAGEGSDGGHIKFNDAGQDFDFEVVDQALVEVDKQGKYTENADRTGGSLQYTVTTTVKRGSVSDLSILDEFTPPNTSALKIEDVNPNAIKVTLKQRGVDDTVTEIKLTKDTDYELVEVPDAEHPGKKTFQIKLKEDSQYSPLNEGDVLEVTYPYEVEYVKGTTDVFWGNVANDVHVTGKGKVPAPTEEPGKETPETDIDEHRGSNVEIIVTPPGDGIIFKTQEFSEADHKLHYTLYTVVPKGKWTPFYIHDDMAVEFGGQRYNLQEFKKDGRVSNLKVSALDVENWLPDWDDNTDDLTKIDDLEKLKTQAKKLTGYDHFGYDFNFDAPDGYEPESVENYICLWLNNNLEIVFGKWVPGKEGLWGNWNYQKDRLIITEYDLDMSNDKDKGPLELINTSDYETTIQKEASDVLLAGIRNVVQMRFDGYNPAYSVFFNNADRMNKTGTPDKSDNTITWTVTMNTTDTTVNQYFQEVKDEWMALNLDKYHWWQFQEAYDESMQAVFYDELPAGWEYVEGSLTATASNGWVSLSYPYDKDKKLESHQLVQKVGDKEVISAPLMFFYDASLEPGNLFDWFNGSLTSLTFTYKLKATDQWIRDHATDANSVTVSNHAEIRDKKHEQPHWTADANVPYLPQHLSKEAKQVGDSNLLQFTLHVNPGNVSLDAKTGYLVVTDTSKNLDIQMDTIKVTDAAGTELTQVDYVEGMTLGENQWAIMPETKSGQETESGRQFKLMVPDGKALLVTYNALIRELGTGIPVSNKAAIDGVVNADSGSDYVYNVNRIVAGGEGSTYKLSFQKVDSTDNTKKLPGATFKFYIVRGDNSDLSVTKKLTVGGKEYSCYSEGGWTFKTDDDGRYTIPGEWHLAPDNYYILEETEAPAGYEKLKEPVLFYYGATNQIDTDHPKATAVWVSDTLTVDNTPIFIAELPETGGPGTVGITLLGLALLLAGAAPLLYRRKKQTEH